MDINSLLSPDPDSRETTPRSPSSNNLNSQPARPPNQPRKSSGLSQQVDFSSNSATAPLQSHQQQRYHLEQRQSLPSIAAYNAAAANAATRPPIQGRMSSTETSKATVPSGMDALAEVASRQRPQSIMHLNEHGSSSSTISHGPASSLRSPAEPLVPEPSNQIPPPGLHTYGTTALEVVECQELATLAGKLNADRVDKRAHTSFIGLLHKGFSAHLEAGKEGSTYELLRDLRHAREFMDDSVPVGEDIWIEWLTDENMLARTLDERLSLMELHSRSVQEEPKSTQLWRLYGDYMYFLWTCSHRPDDGDSMDWQAEDKAVGTQVFTWDKMMEVWEAGVENTKSHVNDSNLVWDRYMEIIIKDLAKQPTPPKIEQVLQMFTQRLLQQPHVTWEQTFQNFSTFVSTYDNKHYEETMVDISKRSAQVKASYSDREPFEFKIQQAIEHGDRDVERAAYAEYLTWELKMKGVFSLDLITGLYERATTRFRTDVTFWNDFIEFLIGASNSGNKLPTIPVLERATRRCPASGELWSHRLLAMEAENMSFQEIETVKHIATASLQDDREGLEDLLTVYIAWCGFLRRRALMADSDEDELDVAEVGIRSALENYRKTGEKLLGKDFKGDPQYRLERIHIRLLAQRDDHDAALAIWKGLIQLKSDSYDFWYRYYIWSMVMWGSVAFRPSADGSLPTSSPKEPTAILKQALKQVDILDAPEQLIQMYLNHCEQHETVEEYRLAMTEARSAKRRVAERREKERQEQWAAYYTQQQAQQQQEPSETTAHDGQDLQESNKRKREAETTELQATKKLKPDAELESTADDTQEQPLKRDREHTIIVVRNLPDDATDTDIRKFFRGCGTINTIKITTEDGSTNATVEFETTEEARYAQTKATKPLNGKEIEIEFLTGATLWVTNYPPTADEKYIRNLFKNYGEISEVRFPSLQGNTNRRFCYVQFLDASAAKKATELDGKVLDGQFHLGAKISDPNRKEIRHGALYEGREVYVRNISWKASEDDVKRLFQEYGTIEKVRIPVNDYGKSKGVAFVAFERANDAKKAVESLNNTPFMSRTINVEQSVPRAKRTQTTLLRGSTHSASPEPTSVNGDAMMVDGPINSAADEKSRPRKRTMALLNVPDTVNSARLEALLTPFGTINKITLRPDHGGAIVEFAEEKSVGAAGLGLGGTELDGKTIQTGTVADLMTHKAEIKAGKLSEVKKVKEKTSMLNQGPVSRPGGRRGGLGKRTGLGFSAPRASKPAEENGENGSKPAAKSNADFRSMFIKAKGNGDD